MPNKKGFSLLSFLLYLMFFTMIMFFSCHIIVSLIIPSFSTMRKCQSIIALHIASDLFVRDIRAIKSYPCHWKLVTPHELIWQEGDHDVGWCCSDNRLERKEGIYNQGWKHTTTSVVAAGIKQATFAVEQHNKVIIGIELTLIPLIDQKKPIICYVAIKQREKT